MLKEMLKEERFPDTNKSLMDIDWSVKIWRKFSIKNETENYFIWNLSRQKAFTWFTKKAVTEPVCKRLFKSTFLRCNMSI